MDCVAEVGRGKPPVGDCPERSAVDCPRESVRCSDERPRATRASSKFQPQCQIISREGAKDVEFANYRLINLRVLRVKQMARH